MMAFKILVTSQKGGVGKSTLSANLVAYLSRNMNLGVTLIDWDPHGSSSNWLKQAPDVGAVIKHLALPVDQGGNRPIFEARLQMRRAASECDILVCDLTWSDSLAGELMFEFDMVLVPTSVSEIELAATSGFLNRNRWVFDSASDRRPMLVVCPTRVLNEQLSSDVFTRQRFPVSFMLAPPILESQSARDLFERGYLMDAQDIGGESFREFGEAI
jgi:cellulose biosynthesis protein BcsQ